jgi:hypothetical protein
MFRFLIPLLLLLVPGSAMAALQGGETPVRANVTAGADFWFPTDTNIVAVYNELPKFGLRVGGGVVWFKQAIPIVHLETNFGLGLTTKKGTELTVDGDVSGDQSRLSFYPLHAEVLLGLDIWDEQVLVPFGAMGVDAVGYSSRSSVGSVLQGWKIGWHWRAGLGILLDPVEPLRASQADAVTGINDVFLTLEAQRLNAPFSGGDAGLDFSGWSFRAGLKFVL